MGSSYFSPPAKRSIPGVSDPDPYSPNGSSKRARSSNQPSPIPMPPGHVSFRLLCHATRIGGVIGKSGAVIQSLQKSTGAKIRVEDAPAESLDRVILIIADGALTASYHSGGEAFEFSKAQEALLKVFDRILEVAAEMERIEVGDRVVSCRLVADAAQAGSVIGKGGKVVEKIKKDTGCKIRVSAYDMPACTSSSDEVIEIEGNVSSVKKALIAVSRRLQDCTAADRTKMMGNKPYEVFQHETLTAVPRESFTAVPRETFTDHHMDHLLQRSSALSTLSSSSNSYAAGVHSLPAEVNRVSPLESKALQQEVTFKIICSNDRVGGVIGKGGGIVRALQSETGATISIGPAVADCDDRLITITASENPESRYSPAQKASVLVFSRSVEAGIQKGIDSGSNKGSSVTARLVVPSNQVGCLLGKGGVIVSEMRKATGASIRIVGADQVPKCASDNDQVVQISGEFPNVQDALYNATGRLRDNLLVSTQSSAGTRSLSSIQADSSPYGRPRDSAGTRNLSSVRADTSPYGNLRDIAPIGGHSAVGISHGLSRHTFPQDIDHLALTRNLDRPSHTFPEDIDHLALTRNLDHPSSHNFPQVIDHLALSRNLDRPSSHTFPQDIDHLAHTRNLDRLSSHTFPQDIDHLVHTRNLDRPSSHTFPQDIDRLAHTRNLDRPSSHTFPQDFDHLARTRNLDRPSSHTFPQDFDHLARTRNLDRHSSQTFHQDIDHLARTRNLDGPSSPGLWTPPAIAGINSRGVNEVSRGLTSRRGGLELVRGSKSAIVTNTTVEIVVPEDTIDSVYGENGSNLARLRQISGAKVVIHQPHPGTSERLIVISGSPDETQAAQSLLQSFILSGS